MKRVIILLLPSITALMLAWLALACRAKPRVVPATTAPPAVPEEVIQQFVSEGDTQFQALHLYGWRRAEAACAKAFGLAPRQAIREKLVLARFLRMTREIDEDIPCPDADEAVRFICAGQLDPRRQAICDLARAYQEGPLAAVQKESKRVDPSVLQADGSPLGASIYALYAKTFGSDSEEVEKQLAEKYKDSPLFFYLVLGARSASATAEMNQRFPDFAELSEFSAEMSFQKRRLKAARTGFAQALALIPDYTRALNGLGNIYFFTLEDFGNALRSYEATLRRDPENTAALFGKGAALHHLGMYEDSSVAMALMLASDVSRKGRVGENSVRYYCAEGNYYKAYNQYELKNPSKARELIDVAKKDLPDSEEINYMSGLLYYEAGQTEGAKAEFERVIQRGKGNCDAHYYLGLIELKKGGPTAASHFLSSCGCMERALRNLQENIRSLSAIDVEPDEREALRLRMEKRLVEYRFSAVEVTMRMIGMIEESSLDEKWKRTYTGLMDDLLARLKTAAEAPGIP